MPATQIYQIVRLRRRPGRLRARFWLIVVIVGVLLNILSNLEAAGQSGTTSAGASGRSRNSLVDDYRIGEIRAYLWHEKLARLSTDDVLKLPSGTLWNTPFGADDTPSSRAILVVVEVTGPPDAVGQRRWLDFSATARLRNGQRRLMLRSSIPIAGLNAQGGSYVPFLVHDTGCVPIELHAEIRGQRNRVLEFRCGE